MMNGRERILAVLNRKTPDRIPYDLGGTDCSSVHIIPYKKLRQALSLPVTEPVVCGCLAQLIAANDADVMGALGCDAEGLFFGSQRTKIWHTPFGVDLRVPDLFRVEDRPDGSSLVRNADGKITAERAATSYYFDPVGTPLAGVSSARELDQFEALFERWDYPVVYDESLEELAERARRQYRSTSRAVVALWRMHYLQAGQILRGYEQFFVDLMTDESLATAVLEKLHVAYVRRLERFLGAFGDALDIVFLTDDLGTQQAGLISPELYRRMIYPWMADIVGRIKKAGKKVVMHSCGAVAEFIPFLIEMGVDAVNPVQVAAAGMNPRELVRRFGNDIAFWGGGCDTQHALNAGDPETVRRDVRRRLEEFGPRAHLVFTQVHNIQFDVVPANILAMRDEFRRIAEA